MNPTRPVPRRVAVLVAVAALFWGLLVATSPTEAKPAARPADSSARASVDEGKTVVTFKVPNCKGCVFQLDQGYETGNPADPYSFWSSKEKQVRKGKVSWRIDTLHTVGMSATVEAPWEGHTGYLTTVAFRYGQEDVGSRIDLEKAQGKRRGTACFAGTPERRLTLLVRVRKVPVEGVHDRVLGSIAFTQRTQPWTKPMRRVFGGVLGSQEINLCEVL
ncbi:hypothetical protein [Nocardioides ferulae]|uniref:hypothetical protein n=1 Tax=Nocardioides ferulae TaxID=2340821 RepID=UPI000EB0F119|nr:hypothetical protein [Nocardioides ferulae]